MAHLLTKGYERVGEFREQDKERAKEQAKQDRTSSRECSDPDSLHGAEDLVEYLDNLGKVDAAADISRGVIARDLIHTE